VSFPVRDHSLTGRCQFISGDSSGNDFSNYHVTQSTQDFDDLIMRQLSHLQLSHPITRQLPRRSERGSSHPTMCRPVQIYLASQLGDEGNTPVFAELNCGKAVVFVLDDRRGDFRASMSLTRANRLALTHAASFEKIKKI
jgi:hypothetical protein